MPRTKLALGAAAVVAAALPALVPDSGAHAKSPGLSSLQFQVSPAAVAQLKGRVVSPGTRFVEGGPSWIEYHPHSPRELLTSPTIERPSVTETLKRFER
jgi:hypothetical protein